MIQFKNLMFLLIINLLIIFKKIQRSEISLT